MGKERIGMTDTAMSAIMKLAGGNPGAMRVSMQLLTESERIDPDNMLGGLGTLLSLDTHGIYEDKIWMLYKDICGENIVDTIGILRGVQLGILPERELKDALAQPYASLKEGRREEVLAAVRERLPAFAKY